MEITLDKQIKKGISDKPDEDLVANQFKILQNFSLECGFDHYEISNLAKDGNRAKHNSDYWKGKPYIGIGPSAHSFNGKQRRVNIANNQRYIQSIKTGDCDHETEEIDLQTRYNELILTGFRTKNGIQINDLKTTFLVICSFFCFDPRKFVTDTFSWMGFSLHFFQPFEVAL